MKASTLAQSHNTTSNPIETTPGEFLGPDGVFQGEPVIPAADPTNFRLNPSSRKDHENSVSGGDFQSPQFMPETGNEKVGLGARLSLAAYEVMSKVRKHPVLAVIATLAIGQVVKGGGDLLNSDELNHVVTGHDANSPIQQAGMMDTRGGFDPETHFTNNHTDVDIPERSHAVSDDGGHSGVSSEVADTRTDGKTSDVAAPRGGSDPDEQLASSRAGSETSESSSTNRPDGGYADSSTMVGNAQDESKATPNVSRGGFDPDTHFTNNHTDVDIPERSHAVSDDGGYAESQPFEATSEPVEATHSSNGQREIETNQVTTAAVETQKIGEAPERTEASSPDGGYTGDHQPEATAKPEQVPEQVDKRPDGGYAQESEPATEGAPGQVPSSDGGYAGSPAEAPAQEAVEPAESQADTVEPQSEGVQMGEYNSETNEGTLWNSQEQLATANGYTGDDNENVTRILTQALLDKNDMDWNDATHVQSIDNQAYFEGQIIKQLTPEEIADLLDAYEAAA